MMAVVWPSGLNIFVLKSMWPLTYYKIKTRPIFNNIFNHGGSKSKLRPIGIQNQADSKRLRELIAQEFDTPLDLVIDDASHLYEPTKASFETLFPYLRPGGLYVIEDWAWAFWEQNRAPNLWAAETTTPLAALIFELMGAVGTISQLIQSLIVFRDFIIVERGQKDLEPDKFELDDFIFRPSKTIHVPFISANGSVKRKAANLPKKPSLQKESFMTRLNKILEQTPDNSSPKDLFDDIDNEFWFWIHTEGYRNRAKLRQILPGIPSDESQLLFTGQNGDSNLASAYQIYTLFKQIAHDNLEEGRHLNTVLDFGCGWGQIVRFFQKDIEPTNLWAVDWKPYAGEVFKETRTDKWCNFELVDSMPPLSFKDDSFDLIYCSSIFSQLTEAAHQLWLAEFNRILEPGGILIATTWGRELIETYAEQRIKPEAEKSIFEPSWANSFPDLTCALGNYDDGEFLFAPVTSYGRPDNSFYGQACISKGYVLTHWTKKFELVDFIDDRNVCPLNVIVVKKSEITQKRKSNVEKVRKDSISVIKKDSSDPINNTKLNELVYLPVAEAESFLLDLTQDEIKNSLVHDPWLQNYILSLWEKVNGKTILETYPWSLLIGMVDFCNAKCGFCTSWLKQDGMLSLDNLTKFDTLFSHAKVLTLTGGEPTAHPNFIEVIQHIANRIDPRCYFSFITNGSRIDRYFDQLNDIDVAVSFSLNAATAQTHHQVMKLRPGTFERILESIRTLRTLNKSVNASMVVTCQNIAEVPAFIELCQNLDVTTIMVRTINPGTGAFPMPDNTGVYSPPYLHPDFDKLVEKARLAIERSTITILGDPDQWGTELPTPPKVSETDSKNLLNEFRERHRKPVLTCGEPVNYKKLLADPGIIDLGDPYNRVVPFSCNWVYYSATFAYNDLAMSPCCFMEAVPGHERMGFLASETIFKLWNSPAYVALRQSLQAGPLYPKCKVCPYQTAPGTI